MKITEINIKRFRSIQEINLKITPDFGFISICGENNAGKTNILRAIALFFDPQRIDYGQDIPVHKMASAGGQVYPEITIRFESDMKNVTIKRSFVLESNSLEGEEKDLTTNSLNSLSSEQAQSFLNKYVCKFIELMNLSIPSLIEEVIDEIYDIEYDKSRFRGAKQDLKKAFEGYQNGILEVLKDLAEDITPDFEKFNSAWGVEFQLETDIQKFRDLISDDVEFYVKDKSDRVIGSKGSGLQRIAYILLQTRIATKLKGKIPILLIDEPEAYLHPGLQQKLFDHLKILLDKKIQIFVTTHSPCFIDSFLLRNQFLIGVEIEEGVYYQRIKKKVNKIKTFEIDLDSIDGANKIRSHLGMMEPAIQPLDRFNILVEGEADKIFFDKLSKFFEVKLPKLISLNGVSNIDKTLEFYKGFFKDPKQKPNLLVVLDNDSAGRDAFIRLSSNLQKFHSLNLKVDLIPNYLGETPDISNLAKIKENIEIEDFMFPEIIVGLSNKILSKAGYNQINEDAVLNKIKMAAFKSKGILEAIEYAKNETNPESGQNISFTSSGQSTEKMKFSIANSFSFEGSRSEVKKLRELNIRYPEIKKYMERLSKVDSMFQSK